MTRLAVAVLALLLLPAAALAVPPPDRVAALRRGINITGWFRFPASRDPAVLRAWLSDAAMIGLRAAGFTFVRLAADPSSSHYGKSVSEPAVPSQFPRFGPLSFQA
ncbi:MAG: hypothetical protein EXR07_09895 [Acetobacteraceae bacterium]|nr:hypothetical protein [Acetobacteraceae bacterium]